MAETDKHATAKRHSCRPVFWFLAGFVTGPIMLNVGFLLIGHLATTPRQDRDSAQKFVERYLYDYLTHEGHGDRGPRFMALVSALGAKRWASANLSRDMVTAYLGTPDFTHDEGDVAAIGYIYRDEQARERVANLLFRNGWLISVGCGDLPADGTKGNRGADP